MQPCVILTTGRAGSSLLAGLFAKHGCWTGDCRKPDKHNPKGYFENNQIKKEMVGIFGREWLQENETDKDWKSIVERIKKEEGYTEGPWLSKHGACHWKIWYQYAPYFVKTKCSTKKIIDSYERSNFIPNRNYEFVYYQQNLLEQLPGVTVDMDELIDGRRDQLKEALEGYGLHYNEKIVEEFIEPDLWEI